MCTCNPESDVPECKEACRGEPVQGFAQAGRDGAEGLGLQPPLRNVEVAHQKPLAATSTQETHHGAEC